MLRQDILYLREHGHAVTDHVSRGVLNECLTLLLDRGTMARCMSIARKFCEASQGILLRDLVTSFSDAHCQIRLTPICWLSGRV